MFDVAHWFIVWCVCFIVGVFVRGSLVHCVVWLLRCRCFDVAHWFIVWCGCFVVGVLTWLTRQCVSGVAGSLCDWFIVYLAWLVHCLVWLFHCVAGSLCLV